MVWIRKSLILIHRYLGIVLSLLFFVWFVSGIGMMYSGGMPQLTPQVRLERLSPLDLSSIQLTAQQALELAGLEGDPGRVTLVTLGERPVYRVGGFLSIFADNGDFLEGIGDAEALTIASRFMNVPEDQLHHNWVEEIDQWTVGNAQELPLHKITVDDADHTELYISPESGEVGLLTTRRARTLAWFAAIPHWLYFKDLRSNGPVWYRIVLWTSGVGCILALIGIVLGVMQCRFSRPFRFARISSYIPYAGAMKWHYITGFVFGIFTLTWVFSGMLSIEPFEWAAAPGLDSSELQQALVGGPLDVASFPAFDPAAWSQVLSGRILKELEYTRIQGEPFFVAHTVPADGDPAREPDRVRQEYGSSSGGGINPNRLLVAANPLRIRTEPFSTELLMNQVKASFANVPILESVLLTDYDSYYYSRDRQSPLPVLRVKFDDPTKTWFYIDPQMSQLVGGVHRLDRVERWLYNGFHSLDFAFLYYNTTIWQIAVITLSIGGAATSGIGAFLGFRRVIRGVRNTAATLTGRRARAGVANEQRQP